MDSEREEGEIVDDLDDLSDISSEEEYLLRQRLQVLESYNNVLERKQAKRSYTSGAKDVSNGDSLCQDLSEISAADLEDNINSPIKQRGIVNFTIVKPNCHKSRKRKYKENKHRHKISSNRRGNTKLNKKLETKESSESSDDADYDNLRNRRKFAEAVTIQKDKNKIDTTTLKSRLTNMLSKKMQPSKLKKKKISKLSKISKIKSDVESNHVQGPNNSLDNTTNNNLDIKMSEVNVDNDCVELIDLCIDEDKTSNENITEIIDLDKSIIDLENENDPPKNKTDSEDDLEMLRQHALKSKASKTEVECNQPVLNMQLDDEDSDTRELRDICLKSALLKKAIERKRKERLQKRLSHSSNLGDIFSSRELPGNNDTDNNTDIESVDMDTGVSDKSDVGENDTELFVDTEQALNKNIEINLPHIIEGQETHGVNLFHKDDEIEEDEDLLRAKLLNSLSNNLPKLVKMNSVDDSPVAKTPSITHKEIRNDIESNKKKTKTEEKRFIINTKDSDSGSDHEATKNLTKMHNKLVPLDFQQRLDMFLKSTRMEVEKNGLSNLVQPEPVETTLAPQDKFVPKALNHLPKSEQQEYKNLVKRMAELEKIKEARQLSMLVMNKTMLNINEKDKLKPRNVTIDSHVAQSQKLEEQITLSRKKIAEESSNMLKLREEGLKLTQKYKIVATELRNLSTAISLNKRQYRLSQIKLSKIRSQHQMLVKRSSMSVHSKKNNSLALMKLDNKCNIYRKQKENEPYVDDYFDNTKVLKSVKVSIVNDLHQKKNTIEPRLSMQVDVNSNKKVVSIPKNTQFRKESEIANDAVVNERLLSDQQLKQNNMNDKIQKVNMENSTIDKKDTDENLSKYVKDIVNYSGIKYGDDYQSPLQAILSSPWNEDPNAVLCPFEVAGDCKDSSCKYLHHKPPHIV